jgi:MSHA pilin protein MshD
MCRLNQPSFNPGARELHAICLCDDVNKSPGTASSTPTFSSTISNARGVTLVELIISMVIISIALAGVLSVMNFTTGRSADPMIQHQAIAIAEAYMEEILLQGYDDPDGIGSDESSETRKTFDDVDDYNSLPDTAVRNQEGVEISALSGYEVTAEVNDVELGPPGKKVPSKKITVSVSHNAIGEIDLVGYRTKY